MTNILINLSNHPSSKWSESQKEGWDEIIDISFPNIPAEYSEMQVLDLVTEFSAKLGELANEVEKKNSPLNLCLMGEFSFCYLLKEVLEDNLEGDVWHFFIPTTERKVVEKQNPDGTTVKTSEFSFVRWRKL